MKYKLYNENNKITKDIYDKIYKIIIENYSIREKLTEEETKKINAKEAYNNWVNMILTTKNYNIVVFYDNENIIGYIAFMYTEKGLCLSEVQIDKYYQSKNNNLKNMLKIVLDISDKNKYKIIYGTINTKNIKSIKVFTHIGFINTERKIYQINYNDLINWINK